MLSFCLLVYLAINLLGYVFLLHTFYVCIWFSFFMSHGALALLHIILANVRKSQLACVSILPQFISAELNSLAIPSETIFVYDMTSRWRGRSAVFLCVGFVFV